MRATRCGALTVRDQYRSSGEALVVHSGGLIDGNKAAQAAISNCHGAESALGVLRNQISITRPKLGSRNSLQVGHPGGGYLSLQTDRPFPTRSH